MSFVVELVGGPEDGIQMSCEALQDLIWHPATESRYRKRTAPPVMKTFQRNPFVTPVSVPVWLYDYTPKENA